MVWKKEYMEKRSRARNELWVEEKRWILCWLEEKKVRLTGEKLGCSTLIKAMCISTAHFCPSCETSVTGSG